MMKTLYAACLSRLGLSQAGAASLHGVSIQSVKSWCTGRARPKTGVWDDLRGYEAQIVDGSEDFRAAWEAAASPPIEINDVGAGPLPLMAVADFVLGTEVGTPVTSAVTEATVKAAWARKIAGGQDGI